MSLSTARKNVLLTISAILFTLILGEVAARVALPPPFRILTRKPSSMKAMPRFVADPDLGWVNAPEDATYHFVSTGAHGTTDAIYHMHAGLRDTAAAPVTGPVLIAAGCSFTYGMGVNDADTWPWLVQEKMPGYHVINAATSAYGVGQALMRANWVIAQDPGKVKAVLLAFGDFQVDRDRGGQRDLLSLYPLSRPHFVESGDGLQRVANVRFWTPGPLVERSVLAMSIINHVADVANKTPNMDQAAEISARLIEDFARRCQTRKIAFGVVVLPHGSDTGPISTRIRNFIVPRLRKSQVQVFTPEFPRRSDGTIDRAKYFIASDEFHPNREFNLVFSQSARQSFEALLTQTGSN
jgi:hypothetical protein